MKDKKNKLHSKIGCITLIFVIPAYLFYLGLLVILLLAGKFLGFLLFFSIFASVHLLNRYLLYFSETDFCTFFIFEGKRKIPYDRIVKISYSYMRFSGLASPIKVYFTEGKKVKSAKFGIPSHDSHEYIAEVLNFLKDKIPENIIERISWG